MLQKLYFNTYHVAYHCFIVIIGENSKDISKLCQVLNITIHFLIKTEFQWLGKETKTVDMYVQIILMLKTIVNFKANSQCGEVFFLGLHQKTTDDWDDGVCSIFSTQGLLRYYRNGIHAGYSE